MQSNDRSAQESCIEATPMWRHSLILVVGQDIEALGCRGKAEQGEKNFLCEEKDLCDQVGSEITLTLFLPLPPKIYTLLAHINLFLSKKNSIRDEKLIPFVHFLGVHSNSIYCCWILG